VVVVVVIVSGSCAVSRLMQGCVRFEDQTAPPAMGIDCYSLSEQHVLHVR